ncbi:hypothetical protein DESAMIL20_96 [Desulfurella amilsii]|uniref:Uncharacterized protein n=2 Tax=Desulfurella amilsii TaxID=1562698 RepID=A0A1X4XZP0_9BACT|nr:hypothetical protein DESAMIL20_96 [Desulfurella amilsii]
MNIEEKANKKIQFAVIGDPMGKVASLYGILHPKASGSKNGKISVFLLIQMRLSGQFFTNPLTNRRNI